MGRLRRLLFGGGGGGCRVFVPNVAPVFPPLVLGTTPTTPTTATMCASRQTSAAPVTPSFLCVCHSLSVWFALLGTQAAAK